MFLNVLGILRVCAIGLAAVLFHALRYYALALVEKTKAKIPMVRRKPRLKLSRNPASAERLNR
ncbi:hypothetical protein TUM12370_01270 [Salmonella enterica subsp. enterica serovar Choleraesuis]|nr:hypothetical protein TUM12370_01270 [Salmonella enterica subsp. enterica serovar Choleraesuis]